MRKLLVFLAVLFVSVISSACINNFAIQELNTKAKEYLDNGEYDEAAKRLESSIDLDGSVFETRYNLAVAYINKKDFKDAINQLNEAIKLDPASADAYYTLGVAYEGDAYKKIDEAKAKAAECNDKEECEAEASKNPDETETISSEELKVVASGLDEAVKAYNKYLEISAGKAKDEEDVKAHIETLLADKERFLNSEVDSASDDASEG